MKILPWEKRIKRAEDLASRYPFAAELLDFYARVAHFQESVYRRAATDQGLPSFIGEALNPQQIALLRDPFEAFLSLLGEIAPQPLRDSSHNWKLRGRQEWAHLLGDCWSAKSSPGTEERSQWFLGRAFLQPYAELVRERTSLQSPARHSFLCPFCDRKASCGILRQQGDGGQRWLQCSFCSAEWEFRRIVCPGCGEEDDRKLPVYIQDTFDYIRVECCESCKQYIKTIDLTKNGLAEPMVDEIAAAPLDLWARQRGYSKLELNLLEM
jgi:formate dehydrogenase maturation protein FdhE